MEASSGSLDYWRKFFRSANSGIFEVIEQAVLVAASDCPQEFRSRRDRMVERFYMVLQPRCVGCDGVEPRGGSCGAPAISLVEGEEGNESVKRDAGNGSKAGSNSDEGPEDVNLFASNLSYDVAEALTEEMEEANQVLGEVQRIKCILANHQDESEHVLFESLRRLQLMELSVEVLEATDIGRTVNGLRKHGSNQVRHLVRVLIDGWKVLVDEWIKAVPVTGHSPDSTDPSTIDDEEGLPSPPLDEAAFFTTQTTSIQFSEFFDGLDEDGNFRKEEDIGKKQENGRRLPGYNDRVRKQQPSQHAFVPKEKEDIKGQLHWDSLIPEEMGQIRKQQPCPSSTMEEKGKTKHQELVMKQTKPQEKIIGQPRLQGVINKQSKPFVASSGPGRPSTLAPERKTDNEMKVKQQQGITGAQRKSYIVPLDKSTYSEEASIRSKLEAAKRKLHEGYQQAENAKKQRTIQVMELHDIPKQRLNNRQPVLKAKNNLRNWGNARR